MHPTESIRPTQPDDEIAVLRRQLWEARDAAIGAVAEAGSARARVAELEAELHVARSALGVVTSELERLRASALGRVARITGAGARIVRKLSG